MKTAVIYARYSSDNQTEQSIDGQKTACNEYAKRNNITILDEYIDRAMTGTNDNRPEFQKMLKDSKKREWDYVLVYKLDRFSRDKYETTIQKHKMKENGVKLLSVMENIPDTPEGIILESLLEGMNQYYSAELAQKVKRGMRETRMKGNFTGGRLIYGYKVENKKVLVDEEKAKVVRFIYNEYINGVMAKDIVTELNKKHIYNNGKPFKAKVLYKLLINEKYVGKYIFNNEQVNMFPAIISQEIFDKARKKSRVNQYGKHSTKVKYMLRGKLICGYCGSHITGESGTAKDGTVRRYYKCNGRKSNNGCKKSLTRKDLLENFVVDAILEELNKKDSIDLITQKVMQIQNENSTENESLKNLLNERKENALILNNIMKAIEQGISSKTTNSRMQELETKIDELDKQILLEEHKNNEVLKENEIKKYYIQALKLQPEIRINYLVDYIKLYDDKIEIYFNTPLKENSDKTELSFFIGYKKIS